MTTTAPTITERESRTLSHYLARIARDPQLAEIADRYADRLAADLACVDGEFIMLCDIEIAVVVHVERWVERNPNHPARNAAHLFAVELRTLYGA